MRKKSVFALGILYHLKCEDALQAGVPKLKLSAKDGVDISPEDFRKSTGL